ncbi:MAG: hypothetical protein F6K14_11825 [Symploca sp. SIO2C1]|nr:hypothetical protein [Symploca sp. SIO2C1]
MYDKVPPQLRNRVIRQSKGLGTKHNGRAIGVKFPPHIDEILRSQPNKSDYIRKAVIRQLVEDGLLSPEERI